jgi:hypothetical protein
VVFKLGFDTGTLYSNKISAEIINKTDKSRTALVEADPSKARLEFKLNPLRDSEEGPKEHIQESHRPSSGPSFTTYKLYDFNQLLHISFSFLI